MATISCDLTNDPICRVRFKIGDNETPLILQDSVYQFLLDTNSNDETVVAIEALKYIVTTTARYADEEAGEEAVRWSQIHKQYKSLLNDLTKDPNLSVYKAPTIYCGGISNGDIYTNDSNSDNRRPAVKQYFTLSTDNRYSPESFRRE